MLNSVETPMRKSEKITPLLTKEKSPIQGTVSSNKYLAGDLSTPIIPKLGEEPSFLLVIVSRNCEDNDGSAHEPG
jgi:hypothetical protein